MLEYYNKKRSNDEYIFEEIQPKIPDINLEELAEIQAKLEDFASGKTEDGLTKEQAEKFLDWVVYNSREYAVRGSLEEITTASMIGQCGTTQNINKEVLTKIGLKANPFNISKCIRKNPETEEDVKKQQEYWLHDVRHAIVLVNMPIINENNETQNCQFIIDPTFRQFCLKENCNEEKFKKENWIHYDAIAPHPGFFMKRENLLKLGQTDKYANEAENLCKNIIYNGYFPLNEQTAKLYGDAFTRASTELEHQGKVIEMTGMEFINNFNNISNDTYKEVGEEFYTRLPSEIIEAEMPFFKKVARFFKEKFSKKAKLLLSGEENHDFAGKGRVNKVDAKLSEEEMENYRNGERQILERHKDDNCTIRETRENIIE